MKWANKKQNNFAIYNVAFKKTKNKEKNLQIWLSKSWWYDLKFLRYRAKQTKIANFRLFFALLSPWKSQKSKILKNEKNAGDITLHKCTKNHNHMMYSYWDTEWDGKHSLSFWTIFCTFTTLPCLMIPKIKILKEKNEKNAWGYYRFIDTCVP